jgi:hypothetical protein
MKRETGTVKAETLQQPRKIKPRTIKLLVAAFAGLAVVVIAGFFVAPQPKRYQGKTVRQWVAMLDMHVDYQKQREEAAMALVRIGPDALPEIQHILAWRLGPMESVRDYAVRFHFLQPRTIPQRELQSRACEAAYHIAEEANVDISSLVPNLRYHFTNGTYADSNSGRALARAGASGFSVLTNLLLTGTAQVQDMAGWSLGHLKNRPDVVAALVQYANDDPTLGKRYNALIYLHGRGGPADLVVPIGLKYLQSQNSYAQKAAARLLEDYKQDERARRALQEFQNNSAPLPRAEHPEKSK